MEYATQELAAVEGIEQEVLKRITDLGELELAMVGGGMGDVSFG